MSTKKKSPAALMRELEALRATIGEHEIPLARLRTRRDEIILELRHLPEPPSTRALAELAGVSIAWPTILEKRAAK